MRERLLRRTVQLFVSCVVLGVGVGLLLDSRLGSDGYSTLMSGLTRASGLEFAVVNLTAGVLLVLLAWAKGRRPGIGTVVQVVLVGLVVSMALRLLPTPEPLALRALELGLAFPVLAVGVAGYLAAELGAGPAEGAALAWDPPLPFRWSYTILQVSGIVIGWLCGASVGVGTIVVGLGLGWCVDRLIPVLTPVRRAPLAPAD